MVSKLGRSLPLEQGHNTIRLVRRGETSQPWEFTVLGLADNGEGGSSVCYRARWGRKQGTLKEFYPIDNTMPGRNRYFSLVRDEENQLLPQGAAMAERFYGLCEDFALAYDKLEQLKAEDPVLTNFFPSCQVLHGITSDGRRGSIYIWTPDDKQGESFATYLGQVRGQPRQQPEHKLYQVVSTLITLTDCIRRLHTVGVLHLDLKPGNFLVAYNSQGDINPQNICLFDVNSICLTGDPVRSRGTPGFRAPETAAGRGENRSDLYSIGAILFYATVVVSGQSAVYSDDVYPRLEELVTQSRLIRGSAANSGQVVRYLLTKILQNCLHTDPRKRYSDCETLLEDLRRLRANLLPEIFNHHLGGGKRLAIVDAADCDATEALQALLYRHPLCHAVAPEEEELRVQVLGGGRYGLKFVDLCLQAGQILGHTLKLQVFSPDAALDREVYLHSRPELTTFVEVDGRGAETLPVPYARLEFVQIAAVDPAGSRELAEKLLAQRPHYLFVSLGDSRQNAAMAGLLCSRSRNRIPVACVQRGEAPAGRGKGIPVFVDRPGELPAELERMAFLVHLCWEDHNNLDLQAAYRRFRGSYHHRSSVANALAVFSKLRSVGISTEDPLAAAEEFEQRVLHGEDPETFRQLVALEHRRWVMEKVTDGWRMARDEKGAPDYAGCARRGSTGDKRQKTHICLVPSTAEMPLNEPDYPWDEPTAADEGLDPLDRVSVELHRQYLHLAWKLRESADLQSGDLMALYALARQAGPAAEGAYHRYAACLRQILSGSRNAGEEWRKYARDLEKLLGKDAEEGKKRMELVQHHYRPVLEAQRRQNYKRHDEMMVRRIPYILTWTRNPHVAVAFSPEEPLDHVASALVLQPEKLTYLLYASGKYTDDALTEGIHFTLSLLRRRHLDSGVYFLVAASRQRPGLTACLRELRDRREISGFRIFTAENEADAARKLKKAAQSRRPDLLDGTVALPDGSAELAGVPKFTFDRCRFMTGEGCNHLRYLPLGVYLRVEDVLLLPRYRGKTVFRPEFRGEYRRLWEIYESVSPARWQEFCRRLARHMQKQEILTVFEPRDPLTWGLHTVDFPVSGYAGVCRLVDWLREGSVLGPGSRVYSRGSDSCRAEVYTDGQTAMLLEELLAMPEVLNRPEALALTEENGHFPVRRDGLAVTGLSLEAPWYGELLKKLYDLGVITALRICEGVAGFGFTGAGVKGLLTDPRRLVDVCTYHAAMDADAYDDGACLTGGGCLLIRGLNYKEVTS